MADSIDQFLDDTLRYVVGLKERGVRHVVVSRETLAALARPIPRSASPPPTNAPPPASVMPEASHRTPASPASLPGVPEATASSTDREVAFAALRERVLACTRCPNLAAARKSVVFGVGDIHSPLMFVGEAPGADEDLQGEPFVGRAGQLLTKIIEATGLTRERVYIANILKCRPDTPGQTAGNRKPTAEEMQTCLPYLREQIRLIQPRVIVGLGVTALEGLFGRTMPITRVRGTWLDFQGTPVMPTYHPAYLLRNQSISEKRKVWEDMLQVMERLEMPISAKQRAFFLNKP